MNLNLTFFGAAGTVTGSKTLVQSEKLQLLIDCGLFQGVKALRVLNRKKIPISTRKLQATLLTHAHLDHCGALPVLVKQGYNQPIYCTPPTRELTEIILRDSAKIQEEEAERANRHGYSRHHPAKPLYDLKDVERTLPLLQTVPYHRWIEVADGARFRFHNAGHILGSAMIELATSGQRLVFSGDLGRQSPMLLQPPEQIAHADILVLESTYGDRLHHEEDPEQTLLEVIKKTCGRGGTLLIPTFAVERAQELLFILGQLHQAGHLPDVPVYLDSPMGVDATEVMLRNADWHRISQRDVHAMEEVAQLIIDAQTSRAIVADTRPKIVLAGSGMITGGRILHYLNHYLGDPRTTVLLVGFQAAGTRGRALEEGAEELKFFGSYHPVKAEVRKMTSLSAHADQGEILQWLQKFEAPYPRVLINHGEPHAADALRVKIRTQLGWKVEVAKPDKRYEIVPVTAH